MFFVTRDFVCNRLKVGLRASYKFVPSTSIGRIQSDRVIYILNKARRACQEAIDYIPSDIITPEEAETLTGIPAHSLLVWTRRDVKVPPHYRLNKQTTRFRKETLLAWLERRTRG